MIMVFNSPTQNSSKFISNMFDPTEPEGHKWTLTALWKYLASLGVEVSITPVLTKCQEKENSPLRDQVRLGKANTRALSLEYLKVLETKG